uniref:Ig-like domain-containing protein n=1 Tax=Chelydra serpentina TaxID=8475 RepID=A0A8C3S6Y8_CHESE
ISHDWNLLCSVPPPFIALAQVQLVESGPRTVKPSESLKLTCAVSGVSINSDGYAWHWIRQPPSKGLEWVAYINVYYSTSGSAPSLQNRISISSDTSKNQFSLQLSSLTAADTATYYCARDTVTQPKKRHVQKGEAGSELRGER